MGEKWEITGDGSNLQRSYLPSVERFHCLMLTLEYLIALENTCNNNKNITVEETELWYHVCDQKGTPRSEETTGVMCVCVCVPHDKVLWEYSGKMQECRMAVPEAIPATSFENGGN